MLTYTLQCTRREQEPFPRGTGIPEGPDVPRHGDARQGSQAGDGHRGPSRLGSALRRVGWVHIAASQLGGSWRGRWSGLPGAESSKGKVMAGGGPANCHTGLQAGQEPQPPGRTGSWEGLQADRRGEVWVQVGLGGGEGSRWPPLSPRPAGRLGWSRRWHQLSQDEVHSVPARKTLIHNEEDTEQGGTQGWAGGRGAEEAAMWEDVERQVPPGEPYSKQTLPPLSQWGRRLGGGGREDGPGPSPAGPRACPPRSRDGHRDSRPLPAPLQRG